SARPGPVLIDLPLDVQMTEIDFDIDTYEPLPVLKPEATEAQANKILDMLFAHEHPMIVACGGIINADGAAELVEIADLLDIPVRSEEHTSELQSRFDLVCRHLLEIKKNTLHF